MAKPKFSRPSVNLDKNKRAWKEVKVKTLKPGDTVAGVGLIHEVKTHLRPFTILVAGEPASEKRVYELSKVLAFVVVKGE